MEELTFIIEKDQEKERIDKAIASFETDWSRTQIQNFIKDGSVLVNNEPAKTSYKVKEGDVIVVTPPEAVELDIVAENLNLEIVYEDEDVVVVYKPRGMVVHPAPGHLSGTLVNGLMHQIKDLSGINGVLRPGIVHRIDKDTTGLLMVAKNDVAHVSLVDQLVKKTVTRKYTALVHGHIAHDKGTIDAPIARDKKERQNMAVVDNGKHAVTHFRVLERFNKFTLVECQLETGRTHQIRVHMKYIGYPLAGDPKYGPKKTIDFNGQVLHAGVLGFIQPRTGEYLEFSYPLPEDFTDLLQDLRKQSLPKEE
ncbi:MULTISPECIES: RluA family pseudouridine synthase [Psychrobacillus]|jgi:23S rRNA pseudouridine1911/1915/1917 synthase|uniref:Pseudouridine synthase n=1 Tax=Psychrobacillus faecigallinarum TaxID=2762235 RepID=A0ABR8R4T4_9BACI|nr:MULTISPECIES: RluA family pseudouridine synthase [Psychrobacillus]MBD7942778.1 RluA family pseudouridine synthase [Psychrobacillus faecigallinarum]QEY20254.1 RluA family pseudouridine synthase [Psychrobacillus sp. AK 1817]QGM30788.1 RluA family pseudouridine synthase [Bacillus sp. N3536]